LFSHFNLHQNLLEGLLKYTWITQHHNFWLSRSEAEFQEFASPTSSQLLIWPPFSKHHCPKSGMLDQLPCFEQAPTTYQALYWCPWEVQSQGRTTNRHRCEFTCVLATKGTQSSFCGPQFLSLHPRPPVVLYILLPLQP
jgi:hypothetical protein